MKNRMSPKIKKDKIRIKRKRIINGKTVKTIKIKIKIKCKMMVNQVQIKVKSH